MKAKKYLHRYPGLEYIDFVKFGQPKLSEGEGERSGLFVIPTNLRSKLTFEVHNYELEARLQIKKGKAISDLALPLEKGFLIV